ncbi:FAD binding domain-containing protein [Halalkalibacter nanhaiisediminis]|uniref:Carbon-monoxide dehydrogenase medium subunit n=1 Tax=Halalkalibacter nanhaiisediminis TaxID=688079 RepID=A0A562QCV7_9BACI|nr:FAD binding domain-containing protein [Halalkalibacter nanhaiisediminis]TWI54539.1 carbon-monoxide dehydrogenase medium subunit [Halalkalibacter nanhaiisediminis]
MLTKQIVWKPKTLEEAWNIHDHLEPNSYCYVSGGTWLRTQWEANLRKMSPHLISLEQILAMSQIEEQIISGKRVITIGAATTLADCIKNPLLNKYLATIVKACRHIAATSIRNQATIGGNIYTAIGDSIPAFLIFDTQLQWYNGTEIEVESLEGWLFKLQANEFKRDKRILVGLKIEIDEQLLHEGFSFYMKVGRREAFTPSVVNVASKGFIDQTGVVRNVAIAAGGGAISAKRLSKAEWELEHQPFSIDRLKKVHKLIVEEHAAQTDAFATAHYKKSVVANLITSELYRLSKGGDDDAFKS